MPVLILLLLLFPALAQATTLWDDEMESGTTGFAADGNGFSLGAMVYDTSVFQTGTGSIRLDYPAGCNPDMTPQCGGFQNRQLGAPITTQLWTRFYYRLSTSWSTGSPETKVFLMQPTNGNWNLWLEMRYSASVGNNTLMFAYSGNNPTSYNQFSTYNMPSTTFVCIETFVDMGTAGNSDGIYQVYANGTQVMNLTGQAIRPIADTSIWDHVQIFRQIGGPGNTWFDRVAVGNTRVNCLNQVADTTPPSQVTGVVVNGTGNTSASITTAGATDNVGVAAYRYELCTGSGCSNFGLWSTFAASPLTITLTGLTANTIYTGRVNAQDAAGNLGPYSSTFQFTTTNTANVTRRTLGTDTFNRANNADLGATWDHGYTTFDAGQIVTNAVEPSTLNLFALESLNTAVPDDQWIEATLGSFSGSANQQKVSLGVRLAAPAGGAGYFCAIGRNVTTRSRLQTYNGTTFSDLATSTAETYTDGDRIRCEIQGSTISLYQNDVLVLSHATDGLYTTGRVAMSLFTQTGGALTNTTIDTVSWGDWGVVAAPVITAAVVDSTGATLTAGTTVPSFLRVQTDTTNIVYTWNDGVVMTAGRYTQPGGGWANGLTFVCFFAQDANHAETGIATDYKCGSLAGLTMLPPDTTPPVLVAGVPNGQTIANTATTTIAWTSDEAADLKYDTTDKAYASMAHGMTSTDGLHHSATATVSAGSNTFCARGQDHVSPIPNVDTAGVCMTFTVSAPAVGDTTAPTAATNLACTAISTSQASCTFTAGTDATGVTGNQALIGTTIAGVCTPSTIVNPLWGTSSPQPLVNLIASTSYCVVMKPFDLAGNLAVASNTATFTTPALADPIPPSDVTGLVAPPATVLVDSITLNWNVATDNVAVQNYSIYRCEVGIDCPNFIIKFTSPSATLTDTTNLKPLTEYHYIVFAEDTSSNVSLNPSNEVAVTTPALPTGTTQANCPCRTRTH